MSDKGRQNRAGSKKWLISVMKSSGSYRRYIDRGDYADDRWGTHTQKRRGVSFEDQPKFEGMKKSMKFWAGKVNYSPLKRFIRNNVGNNWDDVHSAITERIPAKLAHRKDELISWFVYTDVEFKEGLIWCKKRNGYVHPDMYPTAMHTQSMTYVHPDTNILTVLPSYKS